MRLVSMLALLTWVSCSSEPRVEKEAFLFSGPEVDYSSYGDRLTFRAESPGSPVLLFRARIGDDVVRCDPSLGSITHTTVAAWKSATGGVADESQTWVPAQDWDFDPPHLRFRGRALDTAGRHHLAFGRSFDGDFVAVLSANGRYHPPDGGLIPFLGGRPAWAGGSHFHQVFDHGTGQAVGEPVRIPLRSRNGSIRASWTFDNQYVVYGATRSPIAVAATGLPPRDRLGRQEGLVAFQPAAWTEPWFAGIQLRYLDENGDRFLLRHFQESAAYLVDGRSHDLQEADPSLWDSAPGAPWDDYDLRGFGVEGRRTLETSEGERPSRPSEDEAGDAARVFDFYWTERRLRRFGKELATAGGKPERLSLSPRLRTALVFSSDESGAIFQERYSLPSGEPDGGALRLPDTIRDAPYVLWTPDERYVLFWDPHANLLYLQAPFPR
jgi:hypothetical protein